MPVDRDELVEMIAYTLWRKLELRPTRRSLDDARIWAHAVVAHLELCGVKLEQKPPARPHRTPDMRG
jgi:hypothetical protein